MARMLGDTPNGKDSLYGGWRGREADEVRVYRRNQRQREKRQIEPDPMGEYRDWLTNGLGHCGACGMTICSCSNCRPRFDGQPMLCGHLLPEPPYFVYRYDEID